jgi:hypothetical protein
MAGLDRREGYFVEGPVFDAGNPAVDGDFLRHPMQARDEEVAAPELASRFVEEAIPATKPAWIVVTASATASKPSPALAPRFNHRPDLAFWSRGTGLSFESAAALPNRATSPRRP